MRQLPFEEQMKHVDELERTRKSDLRRSDDKEWIEFAKSVYRSIKGAYAEQDKIHKMLGFLFVCQILTIILIAVMWWVLS